MNIFRLNGTEDRLYALVAPLVMNPAIIKQNYGYPFKTSSQFQWFVLVEDGRAIAFLPIEDRKGYHRIDNYYIPFTDERRALLLLLLEELKTVSYSTPLRVVALVEDAPLFMEAGFKVIKEYKRYRIMEY